jgi:hypothetical protein
MAEECLRHLCPDRVLLWSPRGQFQSDKEEGVRVSVSAWHVGPFLEVSFSLLSPQSPALTSLLPRSPYI